MNNEVCIVCDWKDASPFPTFIEAEVDGKSVRFDWRDRADGLKELVIPAPPPIAQQGGGEELRAALIESKATLEWLIEQGGGPECEHESGVVCFCREKNTLATIEAALAAQPAPVDDALIGSAFKAVLRHPDHKWRETGAQPFIDMVAQQAGELFAHNDTPAQPAPGVGGEVSKFIERAVNSANAKRDRYERLSDALQNSYSERDAGSLQAYADAAQDFGKFAYWLRDHSHYLSAATRPAESVDEEMMHLMEIHQVSDLPALVRMLLRFNENLRSRQRPDPQILQRAPREG